MKNIMALLKEAEKTSKKNPAKANELLRDALNETEILLKNLIPKELHELHFLARELYHLYHLSGELTLHGKFSATDFARKLKDILRVAKRIKSKELREAKIM